MIHNRLIAPISLSLSLLLITPSILQATSLGDIVMSTNTSAGTWSDPLGGGTYMYGGDFKMKLKTTSSVAPILQFKLPSASVGCSGISISGGFLAFLGLDKLQDALSDAGSSLMFGIILGMEFTLPAVSAVFAKIRAWANALQGLLQNGCNIGRAIAASSTAAKTLHESELGSAINGPFDKMDNFITGGDDVLKGIQKLASCSGAVNDPNCDLEKVANTALGKQIKEDQARNGGNSSSVTGGGMEKGTTPSSLPYAVATSITLNNFYTNKKITCPGVATTSITANDVLVDMLKFIFFGDIGVDDYSVKEIESKIDIATCKLNNASLSKELASAVTTGKSSSFPIPVYSKIPPLITNAEDAAQVLVYGFEKVNEKYSNITGNAINLPDRKIVYLDVPLGKETDTTSTSRARVVMMSSQAIASASIPMTWDGAFKESLKGIRGIVNSQTGQTWNLSSAYSEYDTTGVATLATPLLIPGVKKYANIIAKLEKRHGGATPQTEQLKVKLAKYNAIEFSRGLINGIQLRVAEYAAGIKGDATVVNDYYASILQMEREVSILLKEMSKDISADALLETFKEIEKEQTLESVKAER
ncbi:MAG: conjugal transfer protein TraH [Sulfurimonas sp.]|jgi:hypothetical protein